MWDELDEKQKLKYKDLILGFASLTEAFAQKSDENKLTKPIVNSKFQEKAFQKVFGAFAEDIGNTSYDASLIVKDDHGDEKKYLIGIKTFQGTGMQKIAQFKRDSPKWINAIKNIKCDLENDSLTEEVLRKNEDIYLGIAKEIGALRNERIDSSIANLKGFSAKEDESIESVYHCLISSIINNNPVIHVDEIKYEKIDLKNIKLSKIKKTDKVQNVYFEDGCHQYQFTSSDSQLLMRFKQKKTTFETWEVKYLKDPFQVFEKIAEDLKGTAEKHYESFCWKLVEGEKELYMFSSLNAGYSLKAKSSSARQNKFKKLKEKYFGFESFFDEVARFIEAVEENGSTLELAQRRDELMQQCKEFNNDNLYSALGDLLYRHPDEVYIKIPKSHKFHTEHKNFFTNNKSGILDSANPKKVNSNSFNLIFEPSGDQVEAYITQEHGKALETANKQTIMGEWILRKVFQLPEYKPLTRERLDEIGINGIRLTKQPDGIHLSFIWIDDNNLPEDYWG